MDTSDRMPFDVVLFGISLVIQIVVSIPSFLPKFARVLGILLVGYIYYQIIFTQTTGDLAGDFGLGSAILAQYLIGADYALFTSPANLMDYRDGEASKITQRSFKKRVQWTLRLFSNPRGIGWAHEPSHLPNRPSPSTPRSMFVFSRILCAVCCFSMIGVIYVVDASNPGLTTPGMLLSEAPLHWRALGAAGFGGGGIFLISALNSIVAAIVVGCGFSSPERWPWLFGSHFQLWSITRFWRRFWHQMIRRAVLTHSSIFLGCIFPANETASLRFKFARLYTAFFVSGVVHMAGDSMLTGKISFSSFTFFMLQPFGITIERLVGHLWRQFGGSVDKVDKVSTVDELDVGHKSQVDGKTRHGYEEPIPPLWIRCVGFIWLVYWMASTAPYIVDPLCAMDVFRDSRVDLRRLAGSWPSQLSLYQDYGYMLDSLRATP